MRTFKAKGYPDIEILNPTGGPKDLPFQGFIYRHHNKEPQNGRSFRLQVSLRGRFARGLRARSRSPGSYDARPAVLSEGERPADMGGIISFKDSS